jgi:hypothetical protein
MQILLVLWFSEFFMLQDNEEDNKFGYEIKQKLFGFAYFG